MTRTARRPLAALAAAVLGITGLTGCRALDNSADAVTINGKSWSRDELNNLVTALVAAQQFSAPGGRANSQDLASVISVMVQFKAGQQMLADVGAKIAESDRTTLRDALVKQGSTLDTATVDLLVDIAATGGTIDKLTVPTEAQSKAAYESQPARSGAMCVAEITVATEAAAREVSDQLAEGKKFTDIARKVSTNTERKSSGGNVVDGAGNQCLGLGSIDDQVSAALLSQLFNLAPGKPTSVVKDDEGWHVAVNRPWADVRSEHAKTLSSLTDQGTPQAGRLLLAGYVATSDVRVNSMYGTWNPVTSRVE